MAFVMMVVSGGAAFATKKPVKKAAPELDASVAMTALALVGGGAAVLHGRRRRSGN
jgi:hypothetical protein